MLGRVRIARVSIVVVCLAACGGSSAREDTATMRQPSAPPLELPEGGAPLRLVQRTSAELPGSRGVYQVGIDDITAGQVGLTVGRKDGAAVLVSRSVKPHDTVPFTIDGHRYEIVVEALDNAVIGDDSAQLRVRAVADEGGDTPTATRSEPERIEALLAAIASSGIVFVRNGSDHNATEAADHLRMKWSRAGDRITTAESFIDHLGSKSSTSGEPYQVRLPDGTTRDAGPWLHEQLAAVDAAEPQG